MSIIGDVEGLATGTTQAKVTVRAVLAALSALAVLSLALWGWRMDTLRAQHLAEAGALNVKLHAQGTATAASNESLRQCNIRLANKSAESDARAKAYVAAQTEQAANDAKNDRLAQTVEAQHAALIAMAKVPGTSCKVAPALINNLGGL